MVSDDTEKGISAVCGLHVSLSIEYGTVNSTRGWCATNARFSYGNRYLRSESSSFIKFEPEPPVDFIDMKLPDILR